MFAPKDFNGTYFYFRKIHFCEKNVIDCKKTQKAIIYREKKVGKKLETANKQRSWW